MSTTAERAALQRRTLIVLGAAQILSGFGLAAGITVGALLAAQLWHSTAASGVPAVLFTVGAACASLVIARISTTRGRRPGLAIGYLTGAVGGLGIILAATNGWPPLLIASFLVYGAGSAANLQARYAGADLANPNMRARAMATVLMATTLGAVLGPLSARRMVDLADGWGLNSLVGPFILSTVAYLGGAIVLGVFLRPDPLLAARAARNVELKAAAELQTAAEAEPASGIPTQEQADPTWRRRVAWGVVVMVTAQVVMVAIMTMTPVLYGASPPRSGRHRHGDRAARCRDVPAVAAFRLLGGQVGRVDGGGAVGFRAGDGRNRRRARRPQRRRGHNHFLDPAWALAGASA